LRSIVNVEIENFQAHEYLNLDFSQYTGITGPSNKGKTAIVRAINWCLYNNPSGSDFITKSKDKCRVKVTFSDGLSIVRTKGSKVNSYDIYPVDGLEQIHLEGFGVGPVDEVLRAHGMFEIDFFGERQSLNICKQLSQPFFLGESPTTKALMIGKLGKTDVIDLSIKNTASSIRERKSQAKEYKAELKEVKSDLSKLKGLSTMEKALDYADKRLEKIEYIDSKIKNISSISTKIKSYSDKQLELEEIVLRELATEQSLELIEKAIEINTTLVAVKKTLLALDQYGNKLAELKKTADICSAEELDKLIENIDKIIELTSNINSIKTNMSKIKMLQSKKTELESLPDSNAINDIIDSMERGIDSLESISRIRKVNDKYKTYTQRKQKGETVINGLTGEYEQAKKEYAKSLVEAKTCPVCMSAMTEDSVKNIEEYI